MQILSGHTTRESAYVVEDYPYGFRLRCKIRYWLEYVPRRGFRLWSQTTNPKKFGEVWNKAKASTFQRFAGAMFLDEQGHVKWCGLNEYHDVKECVVWRDKFGHTMPEAAQEFLKLWITRKLAFEQAKAEGIVTQRMITTDYGCVTDPDFGKPVAPPTVKTEVLKSEYSPAQLAEMGQSLRTPAAEQIGKLTGGGQ